MNEKNNAALFDQHHASLTALTRQSVHGVEELEQDDDFKNCGVRDLDSLKYSLTILEQNIFPIALFAKFQSGKSTTAAAMADGREINPCGRGGGGLRTSAVPVTIYNDENDTRVRIRLFSKTALVKSIISAVGANLQNTDENLYDLDNPNHRAILKQAIELEIEKYRAIGADYDSDNLTLLRDAILIMAFYGCKSHKRLIAGEFSTVESIQPFLSVKQWEKKWEALAEIGFDVVKRNFKELECMHVFIDNITVPVRSKFMAETGTAVIDSPGTMANLKDTERALKAAREAAIVVFVLNDAKDFSDDDKKQLQVLYNSGMAEKTVFVMNFRQNPEVTREVGIEGSILSTLKQLGYTAPHHKSFFYYNAFLAARTFQAEMIRNGTLDELTSNAIFEDASNRFPNKTQGWTLEKAWQKTTCKVLRGIDEDDLADALEGGVDADGKILKDVYAVSKWAPMIAHLRAHIIHNRAAGVLLDLGARPVTKAVDNIERTLRQREQSAESDEATAKAEYEAAKVLLDSFSEKASRLIAENLTSDIDKALAQDYYDDVVLGSVSDATKDAAPKVYDATGIAANVGNAIDGAVTNTVNFVRVAWHAVTDDLDNLTLVEHQSIEQICSNIIKNSYETASNQHATKWSEGLEASNVYQRQVRKPVLNLQKELKALWTELGLEENTFLTNIDPLPSELTGSMRIDLARPDVSGIIINDPTLAAGFSVQDIVRGFVTGVSTFGIGTLVYFNILPATFIIPGFGQIMMVVAAVVGSIVWLFTDDEKRIKQLRDELTDKLNASLMKNKPTIMDNIIKGQPDARPTPKPGVSFIREFYVAFFKAALNQQKMKLEDEYNQKLDDLNKTKDKREEIKRKAEYWRTERIAPLRAKLDDVKRQIEDAWGKG